MDIWCLERVAATGADAMVPIKRFPFIVGRDVACDMSIPSVETSRQHARIEQDIGGLLRLIDLNSGNGTFVNRVPVHGSVLLNEGDVVHFGVTNMPGAVPRTASQALSAVLVPYVLRLALRGSAGAATDPMLAFGVNVADGRIVHPRVAEALA